jgi:hypothetical protein
MSTAFSEAGAIVSPDGQVYVTNDVPGPDATYLKGMAITAGKLHVTGVLDPLDTWVGGRRLSPLGQVVCIDATPFTPAAFSDGFTLGFES